VLSVKTESDTHREKFSRAADLWEAPLLPIPWPARLEDLVDFAEEKADGAWLPASGSSKLLDWGAGEWRPPPPPPPEEKHPEGLDKNVVKDTILAARDSMTCVKALRSRDKARHLTRKYRFQLKVTIRPDGTVTSATAKSRDASRAVSDCIAKAVRALRFPEHQKQQPAFDIEFPF
jgi:hypothetical protein